MERRALILLAAASFGLIVMTHSGANAACTEDTPEECGETEGTEPSVDDDNAGSGSDTNGWDTPDQESDGSSTPDGSDDEGGANNSEDNAEESEGPSP